MTPTFEQIILTDDWSDERIAAVRRALSDKRLARAVRSWLELSSKLGNGLRSDLPDSEALVLFALSELPATDLTDRELDRLDASRRALREAIQRHPSLVHVLDRIRDEADEFGHIWDQSFQQRPATVRELRPAPDREAVPATPLRRVAAPWLAAAAVVVTLGVVSLLRTGPGTEAGITFTAETGVIERIDLDDGSSVRLVGPAELNVEDRAVSLTGSAFFDVARQNRSFTVTTDQAVVSVLGTSFAVRSDPAVTDVTLVSGRVALRAAGSSDSGVELEPGQRSVVRRGASPTTPEPVDLSALLDWTGLFVFRDTPLTEVAMTLGEDFDVQITVHESLEGETLTGTFDRDQGVEEILRVVAAAMSARLEVTGEGSRFRLHR